MADVQRRDAEQKTGRAGFLTYEAEKIPGDKSKRRRDPCRGSVLDWVDCC
jgi:hypothetical protein